MLTDAVEAWPAPSPARVSIAEHAGVHPRLGRARRRAVRRARRGDDAARGDRGERRSSACWWASPSRYRCSSTTTPTSEPPDLARRLRRGRIPVARPPDLRAAARRTRARRDRSGRARALSSRSTACSTPPTWRLRARSRRGWCASATAACPACVRSGSSSTAAGRAQVSMNVTDLGAHRDRGRVRGGARRSGTPRRRMSPRWSWSGCCPGPSSSAARPTFRAWTGLDEASTIEARFARRAED